MAVSFDHVAGIYDATRWAGVPPKVMRRILVAMKEALKDCQLILDVGVGTGRFAQFFRETGFDVVGIDISLSMMAQAKAKGVIDLVRADAHHLPFRDLSFDGSIMVHVIHLMRDWARVIHEVGRITKRVLVSEAGDVEGFSPRQRYLELRTEMGYPLDRLNDGEVALRKLVKPRSVVSASDYWSDVDATEEITAFEKRRSSVMWDVPEEVHSRIMERLHQENKGKTHSRHDVAEVVAWDPASLRDFKAVASDS